MRKKEEEEKKMMRERISKCCDRNFGIHLAKEGRFWWRAKGQKGRADSWVKFQEVAEIWKPTNQGVKVISIFLNPLVSQLGFDSSFGVFSCEHG